MIYFSPKLHKINFILAIFLGFYLKIIGESESGSNLDKTDSNLDKTGSNLGGVRQ